MTVTEQTFEASADALFAAVINPLTYPQWLVGTKKIREVSPRWPEPSSFFKHTVGFGPLAIADSTTARDIDAPHMFELLVRARPILAALVRFDVVPKGHGSVLRMTETPVGIFKLVAPLTQPLIRARNERSLQRLRSLIDETARSPA
jgi:hypothetical protein